MAKARKPTSRIVRRLVIPRVPFSPITDDDVDIIDQGNGTWEVVADDIFTAEKQKHLISLRRTKLAIAVALDADVNRRPLADQIKFSGLSTAIAIQREAGVIDRLRKNLALGGDIYLHSLGMAVASAAQIISSIPLADSNDIVIDHDVDLNTINLGNKKKKKSKLQALVEGYRKTSRQLAVRLDLGDKAEAAKTMADMFKTDPEDDSSGAGGGKTPGARVRSNASDIIRKFSKNKFLYDVLNAIGSGLRAGDRIGEYVGRDGIKPVGITAGDNILRSTPYHLSGFLEDGDRFLLELANMASHSLEEIKTVNQRKSSGHVICLVDTSGSMAGDNIVYAKAAMGALALQAMGEEKLFTCILFSDASSLKRIDISGESSFTEAIEFFYGGGTDFQAPLSKAIEVVAERKRLGGTGVDLIMITDGQASISQEFIRKFLDIKAEHDVELTGFFVGGDGACLGPLLDRGSEFSPSTSGITDVMGAMRS